MSKKKIYLASSWRNEQQPAYVKLLRDAGHEVYDFRNPADGEHGFSWSEIDPEWKKWGVEEFAIALSHPVAQHGLALDFRGMQWCDTLVMLQPCGRSAALELGWGIGAGKHTVVVLADGQEPELMLRLADNLAFGPASLIEVLRVVPPRAIVNYR